ncbi:MAG: hypothetical protein IMX01_01740 [Limnochordaceae bacterium]|nr:hypothetical protein [Limnochordaceae bacterium]
MEYVTLEEEFRRQLAQLPADDPEHAIQEVVDRALTSGRTKDFLRVLDEQRESLRLTLYERLLAQNMPRGVLQALEKHWRSLANRPAGKETDLSLVERLHDPRALLGVLRVLAITTDQPLADRLLEHLERCEPERYAEALRRAARAADPRLQLLAVELMGRTGDPSLLDELIRLYVRLSPEREERLRARTREAFLALISRLPREVAVSRLEHWLKDERPIVRVLAIAAVQRRQEVDLVGELVRLVLVDAKTRGQAAVALLQLESAGVIQFWPNDSRTEPVRNCLVSARAEPLHRLLVEFVRSDSAVLREIGIKLLTAWPTSAEDVPLLEQRALHDRVAAVRIAALWALAALAPQALEQPLERILADPSLVTGSTLLDTATELLETYIPADRQQAIRDEVERLRHEHERLRERFHGVAESWREPQ